MKLITKFFMALTMMVIGVVSASADVVLTVSPSTLEAGQTAKVSVLVKNDEALQNFQTDVVLPEGLEVVTKSNGKLSVVQTGRIEDTDDWSTSKVIAANGALRLVAYSMTGALIPAGKDALFEIDVVASADYAGAPIVTTGTAAQAEDGTEITAENGNAVEGGVNEAAFEEIGQFIESLQQMWTQVYNLTVNNPEYKALYESVCDEMTAQLNGIQQMIGDLMTWATESYDAGNLYKEKDDIYEQANGEGSGNIGLNLTQFMNSFNDAIETEKYGNGTAEKPYKYELFDNLSLVGPEAAASFSDWTYYQVVSRCEGVVTMTNNMGNDVYQIKVIKNGVQLYNSIANLKTAEVSISRGDTLSFEMISQMGTQGKTLDLAWRAAKAGEVWNDALELTAGDNAIAAVPAGTLAQWYKVSIPASAGATIKFKDAGIYTCYDANDVATVQRGTNLEYPYEYTITAADYARDYYVKVSNANEATVATVSFSATLGAPQWGNIEDGVMAYDMTPFGVTLSFPNAYIPNEDGKISVFAQLLMIPEEGDPIAPMPLDLDDDIDPGYGVAGPTPVTEGLFEGSFNVETGAYEVNLFPETLQGGVHYAIVLYAVTVEDQEGNVIVSTADIEDYYEAIDFVVEKNPNDEAFEMIAMSTEMLSQQITTWTKQSIYNEAYEDAKYAEVIEEYTAQTFQLSMKIQGILNMADQLYGEGKLAEAVEDENSELNQYANSVSEAFEALMENFDKAIEEVENQPAAEPRSWDLTNGGDYAAIIDDVTNWNASSKGRYSYAVATDNEELLVAGAPLGLTAGLKFKAGADKILIGVTGEYYLQCQGTVVLTIPAVNEGDKIVLSVSSNNKDNPCVITGNITDGELQETATSKQVHEVYATATGDLALTLNNRTRIYGIEVIPGQATGINTVETAATANTGIFNLAGQRVGANAKGIVIINGKKVLVK